MVKQIRMSDFILPQFKEFWKVSRTHEYLRYVLKGGRSSGKSFLVPFRVVNDIMEYPVSALCLRKVQNTVLKSIYANMKAAIYMLGVEHLFKCVDSRLEITYTPRGNKIYFSGADDPEKIKSIKDPKYPIAILVIEELAEFKSEDDVTMIENSVLRAELDIQSDYRPGKKFAYSFYYMYNPPKRKHNWVNKKYESAFIDKNTYINHSTYLGNPYVSKDFKEEAENVKKRNELKYRWEYLGEAIGSGIVPFDNLEFRKIPDEEFNSFDNLFQGQDYGLLVAA